MSIEQFIQPGASKFRENSADSVVFNLEGHTPEYPRSLTMTRTLPVPRKGNAGTSKVLLNFRVSANIGTADVPKIVPTILKIETSIPVGTSVDVVKVLFAQAEDVIKMTEAETDLGFGTRRNEVFMQGYLLGDTDIEPVV
jgi:hypothetical protein